MRKFTILMVLLILAAGVRAQDTEILVWLTGSEPEAEALQEASAAWAEATGNTVVVEAVPWGDAYAKALTATASGEGADIIIGGMSWGISLGGAGGMVNLAEQFPDDLAGIEEANNPEFMNAISSIDGSVYGLPYDAALTVMYYMPEELAAAGIDAAPTTWEELIAAIEALQAAGKDGMSLDWGGPVSWLTYQTFLAQAGGSWYNADCTAAAVNSEEGLVALEYFTALFEDLGTPVEALDIAATMVDGSRPISITGSWNLYGFEANPDLAGRWAAAVLPAGPAGSSAGFMGGKMMGIMSYSPNVPEAFDLMNFWLSADGAQALAAESAERTLLYLPLDPTNAGNVVALEPELRDVVVAQLGQVTPPANCPGWEESNQEVQTLLQGAVLDGANFEDTLIEMEAVLNAGLAEYGG
jgi:ABC-type glycerol-3-phosphate transport system substrate-binding protein